MRDAKEDVEFEAIDLFSTEIFDELPSQSAFEPCAVDEEPADVELSESNGAEDGDDDETTSDSDNKREEDKTARIAAMLEASRAKLAAMGYVEREPPKRPDAPMKKDSKSRFGY